MLNRAVFLRLIIWSSQNTLTWWPQSMFLEWLIGLEVLLMVLTAVWGMAAPSIWQRRRLTSQGVPHRDAHGSPEGCWFPELISGPSLFLLYNLIWTFSYIYMASNTADFLLTLSVTCLSSQQNLPLPLYACGHPIASRMLSLPFLKVFRELSSLTGDLLASHQLMPTRKCKMPK